MSDGSAQQEAGASPERYHLRVEHTNQTLNAAYRVESGRCITSGKLGEDEVIVMQKMHAENRANGYLTHTMLVYGVLDNRFLVLQQEIQLHARKHAAWSWSVVDTHTHLAGSPWITAHSSPAQQYTELNVNT